MREIDGDELRATSDERFVRWQMKPEALKRAWVSDGATVVEAVGERASLPPGRRVFTCLGDATSLVPLMHAVAAVADAPQRLTLPVELADEAPWRHAESWQWRWMYADGPVPEPRVPVVEVTDAAEIDAVLDAGNPDAWARPGQPGVDWLGIRESGRLVAVGAVTRQPSGAGLLQAITVTAEARGRGYGRDVSAGLSRLAQSVPPGVATLGAYADNTAAVATYLSLGFVNPTTFRSGPVSPARG
ncbi:MAG: GNAT family N-acetyltransferase [Nocardioides sp.]|nr:GNAT family N-acetyltransferase [Nocardioides sp.]